MPLFLAIFEGVTPADARPVVAIDDPTIIAAVRQLLFLRLGQQSDRQVLRLKPPQTPANGLASTMGETAQATHKARRG